MTETTQAMTPRERVLAYLSRPSRTCRGTQIFFFTARDIERDTSEHLKPEQVREVLMDLRLERLIEDASRYGFERGSGFLAYRGEAQS
nr:MAG TPA: hypothetical protein [Siphoviridae sp. ctvS314]